MGEISVKKTLNFFPKTEYSISGIGSSFGPQQYDQCIDRFINDIVEEIDEIGRFGQYGFTRPLYVARDLDHDSFLSIARGFLNDLYKFPLQRAGAEGWCDDTPSNALHADFLLTLFPDARVIHMVRHPLDVLRSWLEQTWTSNNFEREVIRLARDYRRLALMMSAYEGRSLLTIRIEDMAKNFETTSKTLCEFCNLSPNGFDGSVRFVDTNLGRWKGTFSKEEECFALEKLSGAMEYMGYNTE